jgi:thiamine biosynthesis lipoprotein
MYRTQARLTLFSLLALLLAACQHLATYKQSYLQFGTLIEVTVVSSQRKRVLAAFDAIDQLLERRHSDWHGWLDGDLSRFNLALQGNPADGVTVPPSLRRLIAESRIYYRLSGQRFNPALGKLIAAWGFHDNSRTDPQTIQQIQQSIPGMDDLVIENNRARSLNPHLQLDFGGIAKGLAIEEIAALLQQEQLNNFIVNAGGDVFARGSKSGAAWRIAVEDPFAEGIIASIELQPGQAVFTSGNYRRWFQDEGKPRRHHIIDPRSGAPSEYISSATVLHADPVRADAAATSLMLTHPDDIAQVAHSLGIEQFVVITEDRRAYCSKPLCAHLKWLQDDRLEVELLGVAG